MIATEMGNSLSWCVFLPFCYTNCFSFSFSDSSFSIYFAVSDCLELEDVIKDKFKLL